MKRIIQIAKRIKLGRSRSLWQVAGTTALILVLIILLHPVYAATMSIGYYLFVFMLLVNMWGRAYEQYQCA